MAAVPTYRIGSNGAYRVNEANPLLDVDFRYGIDDEVLGSDTSGGGAVAHVAASRAVYLSVGASSGDQAVLQTHERYGGRRLRAQRISFTFRMDDAGQTNQRREIGLFQDGVSRDGYFFRQEGTTLSIVIAKAGTEQVFLQGPQWNVDPLDGTGPSGKTLDVTKLTTVEVQAETNYGHVWINGVQVFTFDGRNVAADSATTGMVLPLRAEVTNDGASASGGMTVYNLSLWYEGLLARPGEVFSFGHTLATVPAGAAVPIFSLRAADTVDIGAGAFDNFVRAVVHFITFSGDARLNYFVFVDPTLTGATWAESPGANSALEADITATALTGGKQVFFWTATQGVLADLSGLTPDQERPIINKFPTGKRVLTFAAQRISGSPGAAAGVTWHEER